MLLKITDNFYQITNVLSDKLLLEILTEYNDTSSWIKRPDTLQNIRLECNLSLNNPLSRKIYQELCPIVNSLEIELYQNSPQLWLDSNGYCNDVHVDSSPNLAVNVQIYLTDNEEKIGTYCFDNDQWHSVPYRYNCGYVMIKPTTLLHGMKHTVKHRRLSLYQSFRSTPNAINIW